MMPATLFGKHPSSSEYLHIGPRSAFMNSVAQWVEKGYETLLQNREIKVDEKIHHFAFLNAKEERLICGSMKLSRDSRGRRYPLVIATELQDSDAFVSTRELRTLSREIARKSAAILKSELDLAGLKEALRELAEYQPKKREEEQMPTAIIMDESFSEETLFYRPLLVDDFIETVR